jgi:hypothetical protein
LQQAGQPDLAVAGVVGHDRQLAQAQIDQAVDEVVGLAHGTEAADQDGRAVLDACKGLGHRADEFVDHAVCAPGRR